ncbi:MAG: cobalamin-dependent protein [Acidobacteriota bacterium]
MPRDQELFEAICRGDRDRCRERVQIAIAADSDIIGLLNESMIPAMREMGRRFACNEVYVPDMLLAARAMQAALDLVEPILAAAGHRARGRVCIGTVKGDLHDIGKNLVGMMLKGAGYEVVDLGVNCDVSKFERAVGEGAQAVLCSALLTTTMPYMQTVVEHFRHRPDVGVVVGGAPVSREYAEAIGASGFGTDANEAVKVVDGFFGQATD